MKKIVLLFTALSFLSACTSQEQALQIYQFWSQQLQEVQQKAFAKKMKKGKMSPQLQAYLDSVNTAMAAKQAAVLPAAAAKDGNTAKTPAKPTTAKKTAAPVSFEPIQAQLFLSDSCGWCKKLKQSGFPTKFQKKYAGEVELQIYEVHSTQGSREFSKALKKHKLQGGVPLLIIGNSVIHGYSDQMMALADEKVRLELKNRRPVEISDGPSVVSITMEDDAILGPASAADKAKMKTYLSGVRDNNEETLASMQSMFPKQVWKQALTTITETENQLKQLANQSATYAEFLNKATPIERKAQQQIEQLFRQNASKAKIK